MLPKYKLQKHLQCACHNKKSYKTSDEALHTGLLRMKEGEPQLYYYICKNGYNHFHLTRTKTIHKVK